MLRAVTERHMFLHTTCSTLLLAATFPLLPALTPPVVNFHLQFSEEVAGITRIVFVNDSEKIIEALHLSQRCALSGSFLSLDAFDTPKSIDSVTPAHISHQIRSAGLGPGEQIDIGPLSRDGNHECNPQIDGVIYSDGSYEGNARVLQGLKARRMGIMAGVGYWVGQANEDALRASRRASVVALAQRRKAQDHMRIEECSTKTVDDNEAPPQRYWEGRDQVDSFMLTLLSQARIEENSESTVRHLWQLISEWEKDIENDTSMNGINIEIPVSAMLVDDAAGNCSW